ncbi:MAG: PKD domain-containing protein [Methanotrichaceae archaeon]
MDAIIKYIETLRMNLDKHRKGDFKEYPTRTYILLLICAAACLFAGCVDQEANEAGASSESVSDVVVAITSPAIGMVVSGDEPVKFDSNVNNGQKPYSYQWTSPLDGVLSSEESFKMCSSDMSKGSYTIVLTVTDTVGKEGQASISITVL